MNAVLDRRLTRYPSRKSVADAALAATQPFSAKQLLLHLRQSGCRASKATVYRTLALLVRHQMLRESTFPRGDLIYCPLAESGGIMWICPECGAARRLPALSLESLLRENATRHGFQTAEMEVQVYARCDGSDCAARRVANLQRIWPP